MPDTREPRSVIEEAEQAAAAGDYASAEQLLREAALLQEASLGPVHADLANTLNNLGVVCEITKKPVDAEHFFRRASAIATAALDPDHPFVATSRRNLEDFCTARGIAVDPPRTSTTADDRAEPATRADDIQPESPSDQELPPGASRRGPGPLAIGALVVGGLLLTLVATATWLRSSREADPRTGPSVPSGGAEAPPPQQKEAPPPQQKEAPPPQQKITPAAPDDTAARSAPPVSVEPRTGGTGVIGLRRDTGQRIVAAGRGRASVQGAFNRWAAWHGRRLALRASRRSSRSGSALLLHATQICDGDEGATSMVSRRPLAAVGGTPHSPEHHGRVPHV